MLKTLLLVPMLLSALTNCPSAQTTPPTDDWQSYQACTNRLQHQRDTGRINATTHEREHGTQCLQGFEPDATPPPVITLGSGTR